MNTGSKSIHSYLSRILHSARVRLMPGAFAVPLKNCFGQCADFCSLQHCSRPCLFAFDGCSCSPNTVDYGGAVCVVFVTKYSPHNRVYLTEAQLLKLLRCLFIFY